MSELGKSTAKALTPTFRITPHEERPKTVEIHVATAEIKFPLRKEEKANNIRKVI